MPIDILGGADRSNSATTARVLQLAMKYHLPAIYQSEDLVAEGGLMSYGPNVADEFRRAASYVDKILRGAKPADLPVEEPTNFELVINLKTVKALGLVVPPSLAARAVTHLSTAGQRPGRARLLYPGISDVNLFCDFKGVIDLDTKIPHRAFNSMASGP
jgi:ABC transporter substrate binding protein